MNKKKNRENFFIINLVTEDAFDERSGRFTPYGARQLVWIEPLSSSFDEYYAKSEFERISNSNVYIEKYKHQKWSHMILSDRDHNMYDFKRL